MTRPTDEEVAAWGAEADAMRREATPGPWEWAELDGAHYLVGAVVGRGGVVVVDPGEDPVEPYSGGRAGQDASGADEALIAAAPTLAERVAVLAAEVQRLRAELARLTAPRDGAR